LFNNRSNKMTDQEDSGQAVAEQDANPGLAQSDVKPNSQGPLNVDGSSELAKQFGETAKELKSMKAELDKVKKESQSAKDRAIANQAKTIEQLQESVVVLTEMYKNAPSSSVSRGNVEQDGTTEDVKDIFATTLGIDPSAVENTQEFIDFMALDSSSGAERVANAFKFAKGRVKQKTQVSAAAIAQPPGGGAKAPDANDLAKNYEKEMVAARGNPTQLKSIKARYKAEGLNVDQIGFNF
jgi:hypothetical protein